MKIPKTAAKWITYGSLIAGPVTMFGGPLYFVNERQETLDNSPTYQGAEDIEKELLQYKSDIIAAAPRKNAPASEQFMELTNKHDALESKLTNLKNDPEYIATVKKAETLESHAIKSSYAGLFFMATFLIGRAAYGRRSREEFIEKNPDYLKKLEELDKTIKR